MKRHVVAAMAVFLFCVLSVGSANAQEGDQDKQELYNRIEELEKRLNELTEESRARRKLEITEEERQEKEKEVLEAVGREYTLDPKHSLGLDYALSYSYAPSERITNQLVIDREVDHTIRHLISVSYSILDNLSVSTSIPFVYRYHQMGTDQELDETDIGDITAGVSFQPFKSNVGQMRTTVSLSATLPTGRSPYKINPQTELSTGGGLYAFTLAASFSKQIDPVVAFWNIGYTYRMDATGLDYRPFDDDMYILDEVEPGSSISAGAGLAYALSYKISVNASFGYSYEFSSAYLYRNAVVDVESGDDAGASLNLGVGWRVSNKTTLSFSLGYGLTGSGFSFTFRAPFTFVL